jgi:hypothetical protein
MYISIKTKNKKTMQKQKKQNPNNININQLGICGGSLVYSCKTIRNNYNETVRGW